MPKKLTFIVLDMQPIKWLKRKYNDVSENRSFSDTVRMLLQNFKEDAQKMLFRIKHLEESNENLAYYHFDRGNVNDAIFRFKLINKVHHRAIYDFFLGRLYWEKNKLAKSEEHINKYLSSGDKQYIKEAEYQKKITSGNTQDIEEVPPFFLEHNNREFYFVFEKRLKDSLDQKITAPFFEALHATINNHFNDQGLKILDLGCSDGLLGNCCKQKLHCEKIVGLELVDKLADLARARKYKDFAVYHKVINQPYTPALFEEKFDVILAEDFIECSSHIKNTLTNIKNNLATKGVLAFSFMPTTAAEQHQFLPHVENFAFNEEYVKATLQACKLQVLDQKKVKYSADNIKTVMVVTHEI